MPTHDSLPMLEAALTEGRALGLDLKRLRREPRKVRPEPNAWVRLLCGSQQLTLPVLLRRGLTPATLGAAVHQMAPWGKEALLITDRVTPPMADVLRAQGIAFLDGAGNAYLSHPPLLVWVKGRSRKLELQEPTGRAFQPRGLQVLFALLCKPGLVERPYREIAAQAEVAHGTVGWVMAELARLGFVADVQGRRRLLQAERLLSQWVEAYARTLRPKLLLGRFRTAGLDWVRTAELRPYGLLLGGEPAADRLTGYLQPGTATFFGKRIDPGFLVAHRLQKDPEGNVEFRRRFWTFDEEDPGQVPLLLVYADLLAIGTGRCLETAQLLQDRVHAGLI